MSIQVTACLNPFSQERTEFTFDSGITINEIIKKIDVLHAVNTGWRVMIDDEIVTDFERIPEESQRVYLKLVPENDNRSRGAGMKAAGGLLTVVGAILAFTPASALGFCLIGCGVGMFAGGVVLYNTDIPSLSDREKPEQDPSIRGSRNQMRPYGKIPILLGKRRIYADACANPYTWVDSEGAIWLHQLFCVAQKDIQIDTSTLKIDETLLKDYSATGDISRILDQSNPDPLIQMKISYGDSTPPLYDKCVHEIQLNTVLKHQTEDEQDGSVIRTTPAKTTKINVDVFFYNGLGKYNNEGKVESTSVVLRAEYKKSTDPDSAYQLLGYFSEGSNTISGSELKTKRYAITKDNLAADSYTVKISRVTEDSTDIKIIDTVYVGSIRAANNEAPVRSARCQQVTLIGLKIKASEKLNNIVEKLNFVAQSEMPVYNSQTQQWTNALTSNPASAAMYAMQGEVAQQQLSNSDIDLDSFAALYDWCEDHDYECNAYITDDMTINSLLSSIASTCRAEILRMNGKITVIQDIAKNSFVQLFTPRNSHDYKETMALADIPDVLKMGIVDKTNGYAENEVPVYNTPSGNPVSGVEPHTSQNVSLWGVTDSVQARKLGMYNYAVCKHRFTIVRFSCDFEYLMCRKGDWIKYAGDIALAGLKQGRIKAVDGQKLILDEQVTMENGKSYAIRIRKSDGTAVLCNVQNVAGTSNEITIWEQIPSGVESCLFAFGITGNETIDLIVTDIQCGEGLSADLTCVEYAPEIFGVDNPDFVLPDFVNKLSEFANEVDKGNVTNDEFFQKSLQTLQAIAANLYSNHIVTLYKESSLPLDSTGITGICWYNFATNGISWEGDNNGWSLTKPVTNNPVYVTSATAFGKAASDDILSNEWAVPIRIGLNGNDGINSYTVHLYKRLSKSPDLLPEDLVYDFSLGTLSGQKNGWLESIPEIDESNNNPCWEIHATALSTTSTDTIVTSKWSPPVKITQNGYSKDEIISWIEQTQIESPNIYVTPGTGVFVVDDEGIIQREQSITIECKVIQNNEELDFDFGSIQVPSGFSVRAENHTLILTAFEGSRVKNCYFDIPLVFQKYEYKYTYGDEDNNLYGYLNCQDGQWFGDINSLNNLPPQANNNYFLWTAVDTQSSEEIVDGGIFKQNTYYYSNGTRYEEASFIPYGAAFLSEDSNEFISTFAISTVVGGRYFEAINKVLNIPTDVIIGDYFTWTGTDQTSTSVVQGGKLLAGCCYKWDGNEWVKDISPKHRATAMKDILGVAETEIMANNSDVIEYVKRLIAKDVVTKNIKVTGEALLDSTITASLILGTKNENRGVIQSSNFTEQGDAGFKIDADGNAIFRSLKVGTGAGSSLLSSDGKIDTNLINVSSLFANNITLKGKISSNTQTSNSGWEINSDGTATFKNVKINGTVNAISGTFNGEVNANGGTFTGTETVNGILDIKGRLDINGVSYVHGKQFNTGLFYVQGASLISDRTVFGCPSSLRLWRFRLANIGNFYSNFIQDLAEKMEIGQGIELGNYPSFVINGYFSCSQDSTSVSGYLIKCRFVYENGEILKDKAILYFHDGNVMYEAVFRGGDDFAKCDIYITAPNSYGNYDFNTTSTKIMTSTNYLFTIGY